MAKSAAFLFMSSKTILALFVVLAVGAGGAGIASAGSTPAAPPLPTDPAAAVTDPAAAPQVGSLGESAAMAALPDDQVPPEVRILRQIEREMKSKFKQKVFVGSDIPSLVFAAGQHALLSEARIGFNTRVPTKKELEEDLPDPDDPNYRPPPSVRVLSLGGIVFNNPDEWTIYLNAKRITPAALPAEAVDLRVYKDFIELRWFDLQTNQIFPIRLRPNQRFNLDSRIFLPG